MQDTIIEQVGKEFGLDKRQAKELYEQYWMEFVIRSLYELKHDYIFVEGLGTFSIKLRKLLRQKHLLNAKLKVISADSSLRPAAEQKLSLIQKLIDYVEMANTRRNYKKYYG